MTLLSAYEDLCRRTLAGLGSSFAKLQYLVSLRRDGQYSHWGLDRRYGSGAAQQALAQAHRETVLETLRSRLSELSAELETQDYDFVRKTMVDAAQAVPDARDRLAALGAEPFPTVRH